MNAYLIAFVFLMLFAFTRCVIFNLYKIPLVILIDAVKYCFIDKKWNDFPGYGLDIYVGYFGEGKSLSAVKYCVDMYNQYGVTVYSNIPLSIPYIPLDNFQQIVEAEHEKGTVVLIDEVSTVFSHRDWKNFPMGLIWKVLQCRKKKVKIVATAQRFHMVDALLRGITDKVIKCEKYWRFENNRTYDAWELENSINPQMLKPIKNRWWFIRDKHFKSYDTYTVVNKTDDFKAENYVSNKELLDALGEINKDARTSSKLSHKGKKRLT